MGWVSEGLITRQRPVPDAGTPQQQAFEARLLAGLTGSAVLGLTAIRPSHTEPALYLHPDRAREVLDAVLPRLDEAGAVHGVPGLRIVPDGGTWWFTDATDRARVRLVHPRPAWRPAPSLAPGPEQLWRSHRYGLHPAEEAGVHRRAGEGGASRDSDRLLSRILRRLGLIAKAGAEHGWVNLCTTGSYDLVIECCCASGALKLMHGLRQSALADCREDEGPDYPGDVDLGEASVAVRHASCGSFPEPARSGLRWATC
ncbi:hypothetical protein AB0C86_34560 [Streptomyces lavendulae]|uniref:hypothetical protein n=1 Tax=Streptomyces lavendulae TaxID=1914 RepID=UPI0033DEC001